ncbi:MAG TPA: protease complex subunit PrcB family protein [Rhodothermales bacterium]|nr:protease complex subunit PrcB family protein [Rhodothermales bacterium]
MKNPLHRLSGLFGSLFVVLLVAGCQLPGERETEVTLTEALAFEPIGRGQNASLDTTMVAIREVTMWAVYQDSLRPAQPFAEVNFEQEMVVLVAVPVPSGGYSVMVETVERGEEGLTAHYTLSEPGYDCMTTMGLAVPFQAIRVAKTTDLLRFEQSTEAYRCTED